jgi:hypothetical protein
MPGSAPRCHDPRRRLIAPHRRSESSLAASHRCCPAACEDPGYLPDQPKITPSTAIMATKSRLQSSVHRQLRRPEQPLPRTPPRQIPIDGALLTQPPRVRSSEAFGRRRRRTRHRLIGHDLTASETLNALTRSPEGIRTTAMRRKSGLQGSQGEPLGEVLCGPSQSVYPLTLVCSKWAFAPFERAALISHSMTSPRGVEAIRRPALGGSGGLHH